MTKKKLPKINLKRVDVLINLALDEDLGRAGDTTTNAVIGAEVEASARFICKQDCVCAGLPVAGRVFQTLDPGIHWKPLVKEGEFCPKGTVMAQASGRARQLLTGERTALNFLQHLCGVATVSRKYAEAAGDTKCCVLDTRKTIPGWRNLEKYAVAAGGATNHRIGLYDMILIKDNHRELAGLEDENGIALAVARARKRYPALKVEVEADTLDEVARACDCGADWVMLDNMTNEQMAEAVKIAAGRAKLEASGGITLERIPSIAALGVDYISVGALTHSVKAADISMDIVVAEGGRK